MRSGKLDRRVTFETATAARDTLGGDTHTWSELATVWAEEARMTGAETVAAQETVDEATVKLRIHWRDIQPGPLVRFVYKSKTWRIHSVEEIGRRAGLYVIGRTRSDGGQVPT